MAARNAEEGMVEAEMEATAVIAALVSLIKRRKGGNRFLMMKTVSLHNEIT